MAAQTKDEARLKRDFIVLLSGSQSVAVALRLMSVSRTILDRWTQDDPEFAVLVRERDRDIAPGIKSLYRQAKRLNKRNQK